MPPSSLPKSIKILDRFLNRFLIDFSFILAAFWTPSGCKNRLKWGKAKRVRRPLKAIARRTCPRVPLDPQNDPQRHPWTAQSTPRTPKIAPSGTLWTPKGAKLNPETPKNLRRTWQKGQPLDSSDGCLGWWGHAVA